jgi:hypothetical protein
VSVCVRVCVCVFVCVRVCVCVCVCICVGAVYVEVTSLLTMKVMLAEFDLIYHMSRHQKLVHRFSADEEVCRSAQCH